MRKINGTILQIRELEDTIRSTKRYTENLFTDRRNHPEQGNGEPSKAFTRTMEVYLDADYQEFDLAMDASELFQKKWDWITSRAIRVRFWYDYREGKASIEVKSDNVLCQLSKVIPGFSDAVGEINKKVAA